MGRMTKLLKCQVTERFASLMGRVTFYMKLLSKKEIYFVPVRLKIFPFKIGSNWLSSELDYLKPQLFSGSIKTEGMTLI